MSRSVRMIVALMAGGLVAGVDWAVAGNAVCATCGAWLVGAPLVLALGLALVPQGGEVRAEGARPPDPPPPADTTALRLLAALQEEGRLVDFLEEDLTAYSDEQIGAAARGIHATCRRALHACVTLEPVLPGAEDEPVTVAADFDPAAVRLTGNVSGAPPFSGVLRHTGWRVTAVKLPARRGHDDHVIAAAEVEIP